MKHFFGILLLCTFLFSCSKPDNDPLTGGQNTLSEKSEEKNILTFKLLEQTATINNTTNKVELTLPNGTTLNSLIPEITVSSKSSISPKSGDAQNFSSPVIYTVTAENGTTKDYSVIVSTIKSNEKAIRSFVVNGKNATINEMGKIIQLELPSGSSLTSLSPTIVISEKATISPKSTVATNFAAPVIYTVTAEDGSTIQYSVVITLKKSSEKNILTFDLIKSNLSNSFYTKTPDTVIGYINQNTKEIIFTSQENANIQNITPLITLPVGATVTPNSMIGQDFNIPLSYSVKAEDGTTNQYVVKFGKKKFVYSASSFLSLTPYIRPNKTSVKIGEEIMVEVTGASYYALTTPAIKWARLSSGGNTVSASAISKVTADGTRFYFSFSTPGNYKVWLYLEDYIDGATRYVKSNEYLITVQ